MRFNQPNDFIHVATNHQIIDSNLSHSAWFGGGKEKEGWGREGWAMLGLKLMDSHCEVESWLQYYVDMIFSVIKIGQPRRQVVDVMDIEVWDVEEVSKIWSVVCCTCRVDDEEGSQRDTVWTQHSIFWSYFLIKVSHWEIKINGLISEEILHRIAERLQFWSFVSSVRGKLVLDCWECVIATRYSIHMSSSIFIAPIGIFIDPKPPSDLGVFTQARWL